MLLAGRELAAAVDRSLLARIMVIIQHMRGLCQADHRPNRRRQAGKSNRNHHPPLDYAGLG